MPMSTNNLYRNGRTLLLSGFVIGTVSRLTLLDVNLAQQYRTLGNLAFVVGLFLLIYGSLLILRFKHRHWTWVFMLLANIIGVCLILWLPPRNIDAHD